tara:strand:+ start:112 stop:522 length:411 start_codon:yes stop_codon:yes gene_type:complete
MLQSDKTIKIYNEVNIIHDNDRVLLDKISIDLTLKSSKNKIAWIFNSIEIPEENFTNHISKIAKQNNNLNILFITKKNNKKKLEYIKFIMKIFGKKLVIISNNFNEISNDEAIFYCKVQKNFKNFNNNIMGVINSI